MLDQRKSAILQALVNEFITTAQPVGSSHIKTDTALDVSTATIRTELSQLEKEGYLVKPHTSAGRIPSDKGYRYFVDHLTKPGSLGPAQKQEVKHFFASSHAAIEALLQNTSKLLSRMTNNVGVVIGSLPDTTIIKAVQLLYSSEFSATLIFILSSADVEKIEINFLNHITESDIEKLSALLSSKSINIPLKSFLTSIPVQPENLEFEPMLRDIENAFKAYYSPSNELNDIKSSHLYVDGTSHIAESFEAIETVKNIIEILEQQFVIVSLLRDVLDRGLSVSIGSENGLESLANCSLVVTPYTVDGTTVGSIGILGPTRMKYSEALATVAIIGNELSERLSKEGQTN